MAPAISPANDAVAFVEVLGGGANARDHVWICKIADKSLTLAFDAAVTAKSAGSGVKWSPDDRYLSVNFGSRVTVLNSRGTGAPHVFRGTDACWSNASTIVVESATGLETVDVGTGSRHVLIAKATRPQCL